MYGILKVFDGDLSVAEETGVAQAVQSFMNGQDIDPYSMSAQGFIQFADKAIRAIYTNTGAS